MKKALLTSFVMALIIPAIWFMESPTAHPPVSMRDDEADRYLITLYDENGDGEADKAEFQTYNALGLPSGEIAFTKAPTEAQKIYFKQH